MTIDSRAGSTLGALAGVLAIAEGVRFSLRRKQFARELTQRIALGPGVTASDPLTGL